MHVPMSGSVAASFDKPLLWKQLTILDKFYNNAGYLFKLICGGIAMRLRKEQDYAKKIIVIATYLRGKKIDDLIWTRRIVYKTPYL